MYCHEFKYSFEFFSFPLLLPIDRALFSSAATAASYLKIAQFLPLGRAWLQKQQASLCNKGFFFILFSFSESVCIISDLYQIWYFVPKTNLNLLVIKQLRPLLILPLNSANLILLSEAILNKKMPTSKNLSSITALKLLINHVNDEKKK